MGVEQAWMADLGDEDDPGAEPEYWEDDDLTPEELTRWSEVMRAAEREDGQGPAPSDPAAWPLAEGGVPDLIAAVLAAGGDPALMTDAELVESLAGWHAVASRAVGRELRATEELLRRRKPRVWDRRADRAESKREELGADTGSGAPERAMPAVVASREAASEIALALTATEYSAQIQAELAADLSRRLPVAFRELDAGRADLSRVRILAEGTQFLSDEDAGRVDSLLAPLMGQVTTGELRDKIRRAVVRIDASAAERRRKRAERKARFALYGNDDHTATAAVERMPSHLGAAVKARVNAIARAARAAGMTDPMPLLEAKVATGLLLDTLPDIPPPADGGSVGGIAPGGPPDPGPAGDMRDGGWPAGWFARPDAPASGTGTEPVGAPEDMAGTGDPGPDFADDDDSAADPGSEDGGPAGSGGTMTWPHIPVRAGALAPGCWGLPAWLRPKIPGRIRLTVPWRSLTGMGPEPGELSWIGPVTPSQARELAAVAAADGSCAWRVIVTDDEGRALAITTLRTRRSAGTGPPGLVSEVTVTIQRSLAASLGAASQAGDWTGRVLQSTRQGSGSAQTRGPASPGSLAALLAKAIAVANMAAAETAAAAAADASADGCAHTMQVSGYRVPDRLRRWLNTRDRTCRNPVCRQPAARCDQDHTIAYHRGGRSCPCNLGGLCRAHHELKQLPGWQLTQDAHGCFTWRTPSGLTYRKEPYRYAV